MINCELIKLTIDDVTPWINRAFRSVYQGVTLYNGEDSYIRISTYKDPFLINSWSTDDMSAQDEFFLAFAANILKRNESIDNHIIIYNAIAGQYKGVTAKIIKSTFDGMEEKFGTPDTKILRIENDVSGGVWKRIASQLNVVYENT